MLSKIIAACALVFSADALRVKGEVTEHSTEEYEALLNCAQKNNYNWTVCKKCVKDHENDADYSACDKSNPH